MDKLTLDEIIEAIQTQQQLAKFLMTHIDSTIGESSVGLSSQLQAIKLLLETLETDQDVLLHRLYECLPNDPDMGLWHETDKEGHKTIMEQILMEPVGSTRMKLIGFPPDESKRET